MGAIAGGVVGGVLALLAILLALFVFFRRRRRGEDAILSHGITPWNPDPGDSRPVQGEKGGRRGMAGAAPANGEAPTLSFALMRGTIVDEWDTRRDV